LNSSLNERRVRLLANCCFLLIQSSSKNSLRSNSSVHYFWGTPNRPASHGAMARTSLSFDGQSIDVGQAINLGQVAGHPVESRDHRTANLRERLGKSSKRRSERFGILCSSPHIEIHLSANRQNSTQVSMLNS